MQRLEVSAAVRTLYGSLGVKGLMWPRGFRYKNQLILMRSIWT